MPDFPPNISDEQLWRETFKRQLATLDARVTTVEENTQGIVELMKGWDAGMKMLSWVARALKPLLVFGTAVLAAWTAWHSAAPK